MHYAFSIKCIRIIIIQSVVYIKPSILIIIIVMTLYQPSCSWPLGLSPDEQQKSVSTSYGWSQETNLRLHSSSQRL